MIRFAYMITGLVAIILGIFLLFKGALLESIIAFLMYLGSKLSILDLEISELKDK